MSPSISLPGIRTEAAAAVRRVSAFRASLPLHRRPEVDGERWLQLLGELEIHCQQGNVDDAEAAIGRWERDAIRQLNGSEALG
jgi:hypothetical protein